MAFITTDNLTHIMAEMTDYCNAACHDMKREIYLRANGYVSPCCILGDVERNEPKNIINDYKEINLHYTNLDNILKGKFFQTIIQGINGGSQRLQGCYQSCGIN